MSTNPRQPFRSYRAGAEHGAVLIDPPLSDVPAVLDSNAQRIRSASRPRNSLGSWSFCQQARREFLQAAIHYTRSYIGKYTDATMPADATSPGDALDASLDSLASGRLVMAGHQPELFHPGVWFKNFVLSRVGRQLGATAVNLIVDNDICTRRSIRVPTKSQDDRWTLATIAYDRSDAIVPYEMAGIEDRDTFDRFGADVSCKLAALQRQPTIDALWPKVRAAADRTGNLGLALAQGRHQLERERGLNTLEVPLSDVCQTRSFTMFMLQLIDDLPRLHQCYNQSVRAYRAAHGIRSTSHPVPELKRRDSWFEVPFWIYDLDRPQRRALLAKRDGDSIQLSDGDCWQTQISVRGIDAVASAQACQERLIPMKVRPRALVTTMYARLVLSDLFLHGIGGGKYDQLNDMIMRRLFDWEPPEFVVISASFAPWGRLQALPKVSSATIQRRLRDARFHPESFANQCDLPADRLRDKSQWLKQMPPRGSKRDWHRELAQINHDLASHLEGTRNQLNQQHREALRIETEHRLLASREYAYCIYNLPEIEAMFDQASTF